jgi:hypothetical protein
LRVEAPAFRGAHHGHTDFATNRLAA